MLTKLLINSPGERDGAARGLARCLSGARLGRGQLHPVPAVTLTPQTLEDASDSGSLGGREGWRGVGAPVFNIDPRR